MPSNDQVRKITLMDLIMLIGIKISKIILRIRILKIGIGQIIRAEDEFKLTRKITYESIKVK